MTSYDVFNGDADGICALHQLRLNHPRPGAVLVTGVKRDIGLLEKIGDARGSAITVLDISLDRNRDSLARLLTQDNQILYIDHHFSGPIPPSDKLEVHIDPQPMTCTSIIVDSLLQGRHRAWAVAGAFGDNLDEAARELAASISLDEAKTEKLQTIGTLLNYNGYGTSLDDLFFPPDELYRRVHDFEDPFAFFTDSSALQILQEGYEDDMGRARAAEPILEQPQGRVFQLDGQPWARRVSGVYSNTLAREEPEMAHALIIPNKDGSLRINVRAPLSNRTGADVLCRQFPTGGGRAAAAGINSLPPELKDEFLNTFLEQYTSEQEL